MKEMSNYVAFMIEINKENSAVNTNIADTS